MLNLAKAERKAARLVNNLDIDDLYDQIDALRGYLMMPSRRSRLR